MDSLLKKIIDAAGVSGYETEIAEGVASAEDIDTGMKLGANFPMGPLALADLVGLDTTKAILESLERDLGDPGYRPCALLGELVAELGIGQRGLEAGNLALDEQTLFLGQLLDLTGGE